MNDPLQPNVALYFDADAYTEMHRRAGSVSGPAGLMGRQVAGKQFLDAYFTHGQWNQLTAVVRSNDRADPLMHMFREHPATCESTRQLWIRVESDFLTAADAYSDVLHFPGPPDSRFAWARHNTGARFALTGVTHTLSTRAAMQSLCDLVFAPFEPFDALVCTSRAVANLVRAVTEAQLDYLRDRFGGLPRLRPRLEVLPLGVNPERFRPPRASERASERARIGAADDETVVLCVGRLSHHAKAHPFPAFHAAEQAAKRTGRKVRLVFAGWAAHPAIDKAFRDGAKQFAPSVAVAFVDGLDGAIRDGVWKAADICVSLPDNIQETFGLVVIEAMASGLPIVGSDWNGYRDLIVDGETGYLIPTRMVLGATAQSTSRLLFGHGNYDHFLAECSQATAVDPAVAADTLTRLIDDAPCRKRMGAAGRKRVLQHFTWESVIRAYETLWAEQSKVCKETRAVAGRHPGPVNYPAPEHSFAGYPSNWLVDPGRVIAPAEAADALIALLELPLTNLTAVRRCSDRETLARLLNSATKTATIGELLAELGQTETGPTEARATIAWLLKYGLLTPL
jgi:glycosyltransferase involved in cell wall biosynthesis